MSYKVIQYKTYKQAILKCIMVKKKKVTVSIQRTKGREKVIFKKTQNEDRFRVLLFKLSEAYGETFENFEG